MTLTLELSPELEQRLQAEAQAQGQDVQAFALAVLERSAPQVDSQSPAALSPRQRAAREGYGKFAGLGSTVDEFLAERHAEAEREEAHFQRRYAPRADNPASSQESAAPEQAV